MREHLGLDDIQGIVRNAGIGERSFGVQSQERVGKRGNRGECMNLVAFESLRVPATVGTLMMLGDNDLGLVRERDIF